MRNGAEIICPKCGAVYEVTAADIRAGTWRRCPVCQPREADDEPEAA